MNESSIQTTSEILSGLQSGASKPYASCQELADRIADLMESDLQEARGCLELIAAAFDAAGNDQQRLAIENGFLYQLGNRIFSSGRHQELLAFIPENLHDALMRQMLTAGP